MNEPTIAFIGGGNMATGLIAGLVADGFPPASLCVSEPDANRREALATRYGVRTVQSNREAVSGASTLVLCVKPQQAASVCREIGDLAAAALPLTISVMAGVTEASIQTWMGGPVPVVRAMPNTPAMVQTGAIGLHASPQVDGHGRNRAETVLRAAGLTRWVAEESKIDAVTALSGSGPAYFFLLMEALEEAGIALGLDAETSRLLTIQTALGAARMAVESAATPERLRQQVTSPGGTTERALAVFEEAGLRELVGRAVRAARDRAIEISRTFARPEGDES
jgi:pyrroline-5-carboxylate reductase